MVNISSVGCSFAVLRSSIMKEKKREIEQSILKRPFTSFQTTTRSLRINEIYGRSCTSVRSSSEPLAEVQRALLVVLVLHAPHPEAGGLLGLRKLREHYMSSWDNPEDNLQAPSSLTLESPTRPLATPPTARRARRRRRAVL